MLRVKQPTGARSLILTIDDLAKADNRRGTVSCVVSGVRRERLDGAVSLHPGNGDSFHRWVHDGTGGFNASDNF